MFIFAQIKERDYRRMKITKSVLEKLFVEYNAKYFDGFLTMPTMTTYIGQNSMGIFEVKEGVRIVRMKISIARNFNITKEELRDLLLHEMIHEYVYLKYKKITHRGEFAKKMKELNETYGFDIRKDSKHLFRKYKNNVSLFKRILLFITRRT